MCSNKKGFNYVDWIKISQVPVLRPYKQGSETVC